MTIGSHWPAPRNQGHFREWFGPFAAYEAQSAPVLLNAGQKLVNVCQFNL